MIEIYVRNIIAYSMIATIIIGICLVVYADEVFNFKNNIKNAIHKYDIVQCLSYSSLNGIQKYEKYLGYNIPSINKIGYIEIDIQKASTKEIRKIIKKLNEWGDEEIEKHATIQAVINSNL